MPKDAKQTYTEAGARLAQIGVRMTATDAVRAYLMHTGGDTVDGIWNGLRRAFTVAQVKKALRELGAEARKFGDWSTNPDAPWYAGRTLPRREWVERFTMYRLQAWPTMADFQERRAS